MVENLFVYGTLAPHRPNEHILKNIGGTWLNATLRGKLHKKGWGANMGYPGIELNQNASEVEGFLFSSDKISQHWETLDSFEGEEYKRVLAQVKLRDGSYRDAYVYILHNMS